MAGGQTAAPARALRGSGKVFGPPSMMQSALA